MPIINLRKYYYPAYTKDTFVEVSDEVAEALLLMQREENAHISKIYYHKAYFSLDCEDGIENAAFDFVEKSPEDILMEKEGERFYLLTLQRLSEAIDSLTPLQASRTYTPFRCCAPCRADLALFEAAAQYLENLKSTGEAITPKTWRAEADKLTAQKAVQYQQMRAMRDQIKAVENLKKTAEQLSKTEPARKHEQEI